MSKLIALAVHLMVTRFHKFFKLQYQRGLSLTVPKHRMLPWSPIVTLRTDSTAYSFSAGLVCPQLKACLVSWGTYWGTIKASNCSSKAMNWTWLGWASECEPAAGGPESGNARSLWTSCRLKEGIRIGQYMYDVDEMVSLLSISLQLVSQFYIEFWIS